MPTESPRENGLELIRDNLNRVMVAAFQTSVSWITWPLSSFLNMTTDRNDMRSGNTKPDGWD